MKIYIILFIISCMLIFTCIAYAISIGGGGISTGGGGISIGDSGISTPDISTPAADGTYWTTARTAYWTDTREALWSTARNTEIPE